MSVVSLSGRSPAPPKHLSAERKRLWRDIVAGASFTFDPWHVTQLAVLCEALDRATAARTLLEAAGLTVVKSNGDVIAHPAAAIERESQRTALRALSALNLDAELPAAKPGHKRAAGVYR